MPITNDLFSTLQKDVAALALPIVQNIRTAFATIQANPGNATIIAEQDAVILANFNQLVIDAPLLVPILQQEGIASGAALAVTELDKAIAALQGLVTPPPAPASAK